MLKKIISFLVLTCVVTSMYSSIVTYAYNTGDDYPYRTKCLGCHTIYNSDHSDIDPWNFYYRQCTSFVAWCLNSRNKINFTNQYGGVARWGHGKEWATAARNLGILVDNNPAVGSVAYTTSGDHGHVAWVKSVDGNNVTVEEYNWATVSGFGVRTKDKSYFSGYIHIKDLTSSLPDDEFTTHTLFVNPDGGEWNSSDRTQAITKERNDLFTVPQPTRDGYSFTGWKMESFGTALFDGIMDSSNSNKINVYNSLGNGAVVHTYVNKPNNCPVNTEEVLKITKNMGEASPNLGGFYHSSVATGENKTFYQVIVAKIPKGYKINHGSNINGAATFTWITSQEGTGEWETYIHKTVCSSTGSSNSAGIGFIYLDSSEFNQNDSVEWYVGYSNIFDGTNTKDTGAGMCLPYGWSMFPDAFNPLSSISVYNTKGNQNVKIERISDTERPSTSIAKITTSGEASPSLGGFRQTVATSENQTYYQVIRAKIPKGYTINHGSNINNAATFTWITSQEGTDEWETYIYKTVCSSMGSSNPAGIGFIYLDGPAATQNNPVTWYLEYSNIFIATSLNQYADVYKFYNGNDMLTATWKKNSTIKPVKEIVYNNNKYELYEGNYSWSDAKKICEERGGYLVTITDQNENNTVKGLIQDAKDSQFWIGATNEENVNVWKWVSGEDFNYNNWATGVPDNGGGEFAEHYAQIYKNGTWNDAKDYVITSSRGFICEYENSENATCITTLSLANVAKEKYRIASTVYNISNASVSGRAYIALYNNQGKLLTIIDAGVIDLESKEYMDITKEITASAGDSVKVFVWDTNLKPLSKVVSATIDNTLFN